MEQTNTKESVFEQHFVQYLSLIGGFAERYFSQYDRVECTDRALVRAR